MGTVVGGLRWVESIKKTLGFFRVVKGGERRAGWGTGKEVVGRITYNTNRNG